MEIGSIKPVSDPNFELPTSVTGTPMEQQAEQHKAEEKKQPTVEDAVDKLNKAAVIFDRSLRFQIHNQTKETMVSVIDIVSDKVIRQIPSREVLDLVSKMQDYMGMIFDKKA